MAWLNPQILSSDEQKIEYLFNLDLFKARWTLQLSLILLFYFIFLFIFFYWLFMLDNFYYEESFRYLI